MEFLIILLFILIGGYFLWQTGNRNWKELYTTQDVEEYMKIVGQLQNAKIKYRTTSGGEEFNFRQGCHCFPYSSCFLYHLGRKS